MSAQGKGQKGRLVGYIKNEGGNEEEKQQYLREVQHETEIQKVREEWAA